MALDAQILLRDGTTTHLTATEAGTFVAIPPQMGDAEVMLVVPALAEANDTIVPTLTYSNDGTNATETITLPTITVAIVTTAAKTVFFYPIIKNRKYVKLTLTCVDADTGSDFDAGHVWAGIVPAGRHQAHV